MPIDDETGLVAAVSLPSVDLPQIIELGLRGMKPGLKHFLTLFLTLLLVHKVQRGDLFLFKYIKGDGVEFDNDG